MSTVADALPDLLRQGLSVVFVGTAAGHRAAERGEYYAGRGNRFWPTLHAIGLAPRKFDSSEFRELLALGIGLTDVAKTGRGGDDQIPAHLYNSPRFVSAIAQHAPRTVAFNGKKAASVALKTRANRLSYGRQPDRIAGIAETFVLPSTSGAASGYWDIRHWKEMAEFIRPA